MNILISMVVAAANSIAPSQVDIGDRPSRLHWLRDAMVTTFEGITKGVFHSAENTIHLVPAAFHPVFEEVIEVAEQPTEEVFIDLQAENFTLTFDFEEPIEDKIALQLRAMEQLSLNWLKQCYEAETTNIIHAKLREKFSDRVTSSMEFPNLPEFLQSQLFDFMEESDVTGRVTGLSFLILQENETLATMPAVLQHLKKQGLHEVPLEDAGLNVFVPKKSRVQEFVYILVAAADSVLVFSLEGKFELKN